MQLEIVQNSTIVFSSFDFCRKKSSLIVFLYNFYCILMHLPPKALNLTSRRRENHAKSVIIIDIISAKKHWTTLYEILDTLPIIAGLIMCENRGEKAFVWNLNEVFSAHSLVINFWWIWSSNEKLAANLILFFLKNITSMQYVATHNTSAIS